MVYNLKDTILFDVRIIRIQKGKRDIENRLRVTAKSKRHAVTKALNYIFKKSENQSVLFDRGVKFRFVATPITIEVG